MCKQEVTQAGKPNLQEGKWRVLIVQWTIVWHRPERSGEKVKLVFDTSYGSLWEVSFTLKEF